MEKYTYRDVEHPEKTRFTRGRFAGWTGPTGLLKAYYAIFQRKSDTLYVPEYLLTQETRKRLPKYQAV